MYIVERGLGKVGGVRTESVEGAHEVARGGLVIEMTLLLVAVHRACDDVLYICEFIYPQPSALDFGVLVACTSLRLVFPSHEQVNVRAN